VDRAIGLPVLGPVLVDVLLDLFAARLDLTGPDERSEQARLRHDGDVGRGATGDLRDDVSLAALVPGVLDLDAAVGGEGIERLLQRVGLRAGDAAGDPDGLAADVAAIARVPALRTSGENETGSAQHGEREQNAPST